MAMSSSEIFLEARGSGAAALEREPEIRERLALARRTESYELAFTDPEPLVSVVIATYQNRAMLAASR